MSQISKTAMSSPDEVLEKFKISIEDINLATKNFSLVTLIKESKSSKIYKGILSEAWQYRTVAIKRITKSVDEEQLTSMIGNEFLVALALNHENIIPFVGPNGAKIKVDHAVGTLSYLDPVYYESGIVNTELDVYSFGAVLFEILAGMLVYNGNNIDDFHPQTLINLDRNDGLNKLIDYSVRINLNMLSFQVFKEIAYKCMSLKLDERPTMRMIAMRLGEALYIQVSLFI
ncbi:hypothetical protein LXL04_000860 [Taraxacum kok-saghyz]